MTTNALGSGPVPPSRWSLPGNEAPHASLSVTAGAKESSSSSKDGEQEMEALAEGVSQVSLKEKAKEGKLRGKDSTVQDLAPASLKTRVFKVLKNAHADDIHALVLLDDNTFVSGSKDGGLRKWKVDGNPKPQVLMQGKHKEGRYDYRQWITAVTRIDSELWMHGSRDGIVNLWKTSGSWIKQISIEPPKAAHQCKQRNYTRINCLAAPHSSVKSSDFLVGQATGFDIYDFDKGTKLSSCQTSQNDWVYCIHPLTLEKMLAVTGTRLQTWSKISGNKWKCDATLIDEPKQQKSREEGKKQPQRPFISAIKPLQSYPERFGVAVFDGSVRIYDLTKGTQVFNQKEHVGRVWMIENLYENVIASCSDDHTIKIWDARLAKSVRTLNDDLGRVSVLLNIGNSVLVSGSCPDDLSTAGTRAQLKFYDIR